MKICCVFNYAPHYRYPIYELMSKNFDVDFYFGDKLDNGENIKKFSYNQLDGFKKEFEVKNFPRFIVWKGLLPLLFKHYDVYILSGNTRILNQWLFLLISKILGKQTYNWWHGFAPGRKLRGLNFVKEKVFFNLFSGHFIYGDKARKYMIEKGFESKKMVTIYNSLDYETSVKMRRRDLQSDIYIKHFNNNFPTLIFIGRLNKIKKLDMIILAYRKLQTMGFNCNIAFIGDGPERKKLEELSNNDKNIWFYGALYDENIIARLLYNADLCLSPGNVGLTAIHAIYYGLPVITNNSFTYQMPEHEAIVPLKTGDFFAENNVDSLAAVIINWFKINPNRERIRNECYKVADTKFNPYYQISVLKKMILKDKFTKIT